MSEIILRVDGFELRAGSRDDEPRVGDLELARHAGLADVHKIRAVIQTAIADGLLRETEDFRISAYRAENAGRGRPADSYELTRRGAVKVITRLRTKKAIEITNAVVDVFLKATDMLREPVRAFDAPAVQNVLATYREATTFLRDVPELRAAMSDAISVCAFRLKAKRQAIAGLVRRMIRRQSEYQATVEQLGWVRTVLEEASRMIAVERQLRMRPSPPANPRQRRLFDTN